MRRALTKIFNQTYTLHNSIDWVQSGNEYFDRLEELINSSIYEIHLQTYIFSADSTGNKIIEALIRASVRNVQVFIMVDAFGSQDLNSFTIMRMRNSGIHFKKFGEIFSKGRFHIGRRMHQKITVIDGHASIVGGINISDNYNSLPGKTAWLDFAVIMNGDISQSLQYICRQRWAGRKFSYTSKKKLLKNSENENKLFGSTSIRFRRNDFIRNKNEIAISYREALRHAGKSILIVGGYFLPGGRTRRLMKKAVQRGISITVLISEKSDVKILVFARKYLYAWLIRSGINVFEYTPSNLHGKVIITDEKWTSIGSYDLNNLSTFSNIELNVDIKDAFFSENLSHHIHQIISNDCIKLTTDNMYRYKSVFSKFKMWISYRFVKTLFVLSLLLAGKRE